MSRNIVVDHTSQQSRESTQPRPAYYRLTDAESYYVRKARALRSATYHALFRHYTTQMLNTMKRWLSHTYRPHTPAKKPH
jgi:hypothetical protein